MNYKFTRILHCILPVAVLIGIYLFCNLQQMSVLIKYIVTFITLFSVIMNTFFSNKLSASIRKILLVISYITPIMLGIYICLVEFDLLKYFTSITATKELILATGAKGRLVFIFIQIAEVVFLPIPAVALILVGIIVYGPLQTAIYCTIGVLIGSFISFMIGKTFGYKFISWILGESKINKYMSIIQKKGKYILALVFIFPFFPDDVFCMLAGMSSMTFKEFFVITTTIRPITICVMCLFGGGAILSINSFAGIIMLIISIIIILIAIIVLFKNTKRIKALFVK